MSAGGGDGAREAELVAALGAVRARIAAACDAAGRDQRDVTLIAVTKTRPAGDVAALARLGVRDFGESKDQEARAKIADLDALGGMPPVRWHVVGRLQTNKARSVTRYAQAVHSVDRVKLATALADAVATADREPPLDVFAQVSLDDDPDRGGVATADLDRLLDMIAGRRELRLRGVMAVPPMGSDADVQFARLAELSRQVRARHHGADAISAGMSDDFESAVRHGATHVRIGTALLGRRPPVLG
ncbi:YggS family pyridoxal phosphate-dependent enzyme [uncultured Jatrophihabitans sp.]|uniref:YggS family pyridoxal phosphate-dependent enzyme n=1 Tax=uncultured Jatrophihabitans sp. TaxID=1610747 RepID=UPI0035CC3C13